MVAGPYILGITFDDNASKTIDFWPMLRGELYDPLRDRALFERVRLDEEIGTLVWPNGADFDPATLHDWDEVGEAMTGYDLSIDYHREPGPPFEGEDAAWVEALWTPSHKN